MVAKGIILTMTDSRASLGGLRSNGTGRRPILIALDVSIFRRPAAVGVVRRVSLSGVEMECLDRAALSRDNLFDVSFDAILAGLARLARTDAEPDGFFVRTGCESGRFWRLNGQLHELGERLWRADLRGDCTFAAIDEILGLLGWPHTPVVFQLVQKGVTLGEADFRRWATG